MKKIQFSNHIFEKQIINFETNLAILIGDSGSGKSEILNTLAQGLKGKIANFLVDDEKVDNDSFQVIYLEEYFNIKETLKISKTSLIRNNIIRKLNNIIISSQNKKYQEVNEQLEKNHQVLNDLLKEEIFCTLNQTTIKNNLILKENLEVFSINNIIDKLLKIQIFNTETQNIIDEDNYSHFMLRILLFNLLKNTLDFNDKLRTTVILFDLPELYGTPKILFELNIWFKKLLNENIVLIIVSNSPEYLISLAPAISCINLIKGNHITYIKNFCNIIKDCIILFSFWESKSNDLIDYKNSLAKLIEKEDVEIEIKYIFENVYENIIKSLFADEVILGIKKLNYNLKEKYIVQNQGDVRKLIFLYTILLNGFNILAVWNSEGITNYEKINEIIS